MADNDGIEGIRLASGRQLYGIEVVSTIDFVLSVAHGSYDRRTLAIADWCRQCMNAPLGRKPLCLTCDHQFRGAPLRFVLLEGVNAALVCGQCARCAVSTSPQQVARQLVAHFKDMAIELLSPGGHA